MIIILFPTFVSLLFYADINECATNPCHAEATCTDTVGSFTCACNQGYAGNGFQCAGRQKHSPCQFYSCK